MVFVIKTFSIFFLTVMLLTVKSRPHFAFDGGNDKIYFPDSEEESKDTFAAETPTCARGGQTFCEDSDNYPQERIKNILKVSKSSKEYFFSDEEPDDLADRISQQEESFICRSFQQIIFPKLAKNKNKQWKYIINIDDKHSQGIKIETCARQNGPCEIFSNIPNGYKMTCKQKYMYRRLLAVNESGMLAPDVFELPSACCCAYRKDFTFLSHFGEIKID